MRNILALCSSAILLCSCAINLNDTTPPQKSSMEKLEDLCQQGSKEACEVLDLKQKQKDEENKNKLKLSGAHDKGKR
ncbi:hypothetical protein [Fluviispira multicolorata]|uniref:Lipoprotein n=1 Tax=Fluviispira multicolorata TaxID=2654512 RepID=A0A833JF29_9BACT|nr:hypothetical protein [Fluviispira multicolorata]KAB8033514.1 hypothetical protein GCL57_02075 [Fluviispira multicolorata]